MRSCLLLASTLPFLLIGLGAAWAQQPAAPSGPPVSPARVSGDFVYVSGMLPTNGDGTIAAGDIKSQTARTLDNLDRLLREHGSRLERAASLTVYLRNASDFASMNEVYARYWRKDAPSRATVVAAPVAPDALIEVSLVGIRDGAERVPVQPKDWLPSPNPYSYAIKSGDTLFVSGLVARDARQNATAAGDITSQTTLVLENARQVLDAAGFSLRDVVSARVYLPDIDTFRQMNAAYSTVFPTVPPARATVRCGLMRSEYLVEIALVAVRGGDRRAVTTPAADGSPGKPNPVLSSAVEVGDRLYLSGMLGQTEATRADVGAQTRETLARLGRTLRAAGFEWKDVVDTVVYLTRAHDYDAMNQAYRSVLSAPFPARVTVEVGLVASDALVEIMMTAVKGR